MESEERAQTRVSGDSGDPLIGRLLEGRYLLRRRIARGGMAGVYEGVDTRLDRTVAIKVMHAGLGDDDEFAARFVREARAAARLSHPHVVSVFDQGDDDGTVYLAMEYVPGHTLRDVIREESPLSPARALALVEPVLSALATAHRAGLVHRDIKPENVLIADEQVFGQVKVADFGLAKAVSAETRHTATGVLIGTVAYLAPELVVQGQADERADVYAVGVVLYELLTGHKPHEGDSQIQVAYKHVHEDVPAPSLRAPGIPAYVDALVARATARDRAQRPADATVLLHQVHRVAQALADGIEQDPELEADLRPAPVLEPLAVEEAADDEGFVELDDPTAVREPVGGVGSDSRPVLDEPATQVAAPRVPAEEENHTRQIQTLPPAERPTIPRLPAPISDVEPGGHRQSGTRSRRGPLVLVLALLLVAGVGVGAWWFGFARYTTTPGVLGMTEQKATGILEDAGLTAKAGEPAYSESVPEGQVVATDPDPGARVLDGGTVTLVLSLGQERYEVPKLAGLSLDEAQDAIRETNLAYGRKEDRYSETVPEGVVISTDPAAGTVLRPGAAVNVVVSQGRKPREVTDWTGKDADKAQAALERKKLVVAREEVFDDDVPAGTVVSQDPTTGTLFKGDTVTLVVSKGPELVEVPRVIGQGVEAATATLEGLGFAVQVEEAGQYIGLGFVLNTDPGAGEQVPKGTTITLYLV